MVEERLGPNTKVSNLCRLVREARHDLLVITDSDVQVEPGYLRSVAAMFRGPGVGGVTALYRGRDNLQFVAALDCVGSSAAFCGAALVARELEGLKFMMGSTMATTKERLAEIGGFEAMVDLHSDDYELGRRIAARGYRIELLLRTRLDGVSLGDAGCVPAPRVALGHRHPQHSPWRPFRHAVHARTSLGDRRRVRCAICSNRRGYLAAYFVLRFAMAWAVGVWGLHDPVLRRRILAFARARSALVFRVARELRNEPHRVAGKFLHAEKGRMIPVVPRAGRG